MHQDALAWVKASEEDLRSAQDLFGTGRYLHVLFFCQQAVETRLKAVIIHNTGAMPARTHDLLRLATDAAMRPTPAEQTFLKNLTSSYVESRYPENANFLATQPTREDALAVLGQTLKVLQWCDQQMK